MIQWINFVKHVVKLTTVLHVKQIIIFIINNVMLNVQLFRNIVLYYFFYLFKLFIFLKKKF